LSDQSNTKGIAVEILAKIIGTLRGMGDQKNMPSGMVVSVIRQWATVLLTITAWLFLSNHCALGLSGVVEPASDVVGCPMHSTPAKEKKPAAALPCCKDLRAVATHAAKSVAAMASQLLGAQNYVAAVFLTPPRLTARILALETGPPHSLSFAESILQRSILAHAPPAGLPRL